MYAMAGEWAELFEFIIAFLNTGSTPAAPGEVSISPGSRSFWDSEGDGSDSITETSKAVDKGIHELKTVESRVRGFGERVTCVGMVIFNDLVILSTIVWSPFSLSPTIVALYTAHICSKTS